MPLDSGTRLGPYEIVAPLGSGGMGEVYRARDTRLAREVAVKVVTTGRAASDELRRRFEREGRIISSLGHPHICALHDVGREGDVDFLVMELLEGETLADRLARGPIPFAQVLQIGAPIASALGAAHAKGIVHRDLKPANVMLTKSGVKLLDFGLAGADPERIAGAQTVSVLTEVGAIRGTVPYMAPEQLEGKVADGRTDIFALGAVLFEMATRRRAFPETTQPALISSILSSDPPPVSSLQPTSPPLFDRLVARCLAKDPDARWQSAHDLALHLRGIAEQTAAPARDRRRAVWVPWVFAAAAILALGATLLFRKPPHQARAVTVRLSVAPPVGGAFLSNIWGNVVAVSPDGSQLAFLASDSTGTQRVWVRPLGEIEARALAGSEDATSVFWSPDGRALAFFARGQLKRADRSGGAPVPICSVSPVGDCSGTWGTRGDILFVPHQQGPIYRVSASGGAPSILVPVRHARFAFPWFLPDGNSFVCFARGDDGNDSLVFVAPGRAPRGILAGVSMAQFADPGYLVYLRGGTLLGQRFDPAAGRLTGAPFAIAPFVRNYLSTGWGAFGTSAGGTLAYGSSANVQRLVLMDRSGRETEAVGSPGALHDLSIAPDGRRVLVSREELASGTSDLWSLDLERGVETRLTSDRRSEFSGVWLPGERSIVYSSAEGGPPFHLTRRDLDTDRGQDALPTRHFQTAQDVSPDGRTLVYTQRGEGGDDVWQSSLSGEGQPSPLITSTSMKSAARFAPDGRFLAFISDESGHPEAYVTPYPDLGEKIRISKDGAMRLRWCRGTREIIYLSPDRRLWSVPVRTTPSLQIGAPVLLFEVAAKEDWGDFDVMPDGQHILAIVPQVIADELPLTVVVNWPSSVER